MSFVCRLLCVCWVCVVGIKLTFFLRLLECKIKRNNSKTRCLLFLTWLIEMKLYSIIMTFGETTGRNWLTYVLSIDRQSLLLWVVFFRYNLLRKGLSAVIDFILHLPIQILHLKEFVFLAFDHIRVQNLSLSPCSIVYSFFCSVWANQTKNCQLSFGIGWVILWTVGDDDDLYFVALWECRRSLEPVFYFFSFEFTHASMSSSF